jgi:hypothetical protein
VTPATSAQTAPRLVARTLARLVAVITSAPPRPAARASRRRAARVALGTFVFGAVFLHLAALFAMDVAWPQLRDPEYGRRTAQLSERVVEHPDRPLVLVVGSSRSAMGVRPGAWEAVRPGTPHDPLLFNLSVVGAGPITELLVMRRALADGFRPAVVLLEFWPPLLHQDGTYADAKGFVPVRLRRDDCPVIRDYFPNPDRMENAMRTSRVNVLSANRNRLMLQAVPHWVPFTGRVDQTWAGLDKWGWLPGMDPAPEDAETRRRLTDRNREVCCARLAECAIHPDSDRALREVVATVRASGARVGFLYLPESTEFQGWYPPAVEAASRAYLTALSGELGVPVIDARRWMDDRELADGFHLSRVGAARFTARLGPAVAATFPIGGER